MRLPALMQTAAKPGSAGLAVACAVIAMLLAAGGIAAAQSRQADTISTAGRYDPQLHFRTISTQRFDIYFHQGEDALAARVAGFVEEVAATVDQRFGRPHGRIHVVLVDQSDQSNGWATVFPYNLIELAAVPPPRTLVSTPVHLRALLATNLAPPALHAVVSATAPLDEVLARQVEQRFGAPLVEIYGSTESGQIASRHPTRSKIWHLYPGVTLSTRAERIWASGGHIETPVALGDHIEPLDEEHFELGARLQDVVNIAGKRNSISYLNHQLLTIPGVQDGAFFLPQEVGDSPTGVARLCALVVAPALDCATVLRHLRERIDPVFLPRPLRLVTALPRNSTGKLSVQVLRSLMGRR